MREKVERQSRSENKGSDRSDCPIELSERIDVSALEISQADTFVSLERTDPLHSNSVVSSHSL